MILKQIIYPFFILIAVFSPRGVSAQVEDEGHMKVAMRMIGHKILLMTGDSTSRVLPIEKINDGQYRINFEAPFNIYPYELSDRVAEVVEETGISDSYRVEIKTCETQDVHYSYEMGDSTQNDIVPCSTRLLSENCYYLIFTALSKPAVSSTLPTPSRDGLSERPEGGQLYLWTIILLLIPILVIGFFWYQQRKKSRRPSHLTIIGKYQFDKRNMVLLLPEQKIELSSKESDLLSVLHDAANSTVERELILKLVWGDEGDYIGRTLDVFISKLRKKLQEDTNIKIINIRGVGYKLVINGMDD
jgi:hypothetical protein